MGDGTGASDGITGDGTTGDDATGAVLGVVRSFAGRRWTERPHDARAALAIAQRLGVPDLVGRVLAGRGVGPEEAERFLAPTLRELLPDPSLFRDMDRAAERVARAVTAGEGIAIFGDYDVDGATSAALLVRFLRAVGADPRIYVPDRIVEGYGPNAAALALLAAEGARVVVTVDCGTTAFAALEAGRAAGLDVIVVDHHVAEPALPPAYAVVNPNRLDETAGHGTLAAVGVAFLLAVAVNRHLRQAGWFAGRAAPDLLQWLDLVALGTVCDVMPLTGLNRALVAQGLKVMARRANPGLVALADVARLDQRPAVYHLGFLLGPRVNAGGRVGRADLGARLLSTDDPGEAAAIAAELDGYNEERRRLEAAVLEAALAAVGTAPAPVIVAAGEGWHPGVIGIVASRLKDRFDRPACVVAVADGVARGSGRSVPGFALGEAVIAARQAGLLDAGGGHAMAAGFTLRPERLDALARFLAERFAASAAAVPRAAELRVDAVLACAAADPALCRLLERAGPYGVGHPEPRMALAHLLVERAQPVGQGHLSLTLADGGGTRIKGIAFRAMDAPLGPALLARRGETVHVAGRIAIDDWQGRDGVEIRVEDAAPAGGG